MTSEDKQKELTELHEEARQCIREAKSTIRHRRMRHLAQTRLREAYSESQLVIEPDSTITEESHQ